jgi:hypothetical protein
MNNVKVTVGEIWSFKLNSGEEVIGKVIEINNDYLLLNDPVSVAPGPKGLGLVPSMFTHNAAIPVTLNTNNIAMYVPTDENIQAKYVEATTGIEVPSKKVLMG